MAHITIRNIGPIKEVDIDLNKINVFMGAQSSGKSTIAKIICHCQWVEKKCFPAVDKEQMMLKYSADFYDNMVKHHRLLDYFNTKSEIKYKGDFISIAYNHNDRQVSIKENQKNKYSYPKIAYIPSERNLLAVIPTLSKYNDTDDYILDFMYDWFDARENIRELSLKNILKRNVKYSYDNDRDYIVDGGTRMLLSNASSGVQALTPMMTVLENSVKNIYKKERVRSYEEELVARKMKDAFSTKEEFDKAINATFNYNYSRIFLEEPEQNLFPNTQINFLYWLISMVRHKKHQLTLTTHSPYILFALNNCMMGGLVNLAISQNKRLGFNSSSAWIKPENVSIYEIEDGKLRCIQDKDGIIEDNYLNQAYKEVSSEYLSLLEYYDDDEE